MVAGHERRGRRSTLPLSVLPDISPTCGGDWPSSLISRIVGVAARAPWQVAVAISPLVRRIQIAKMVEIVRRHRGRRRTCAMTGGRPFSPLVGEMSGRTERGNVEHHPWPTPTRPDTRPSPLHLPGGYALAGGGVLAVLELDALRQQFVADAVGLGPVLCGDEGQALFNRILIVLLRRMAEWSASTSIPSSRSDCLNSASRRLCGGLALSISI